jgi:hypothetical protein
MADAGDAVAMSAPMSNAPDASRTVLGSRGVTDGFPFGRDAVFIGMMPWLFSQADFSSCGFWLGKQSQDNQGWTWGGLSVLSQLWSSPGAWGPGGNGRGDTTDYFVTALMK